MENIEDFFISHEMKLSLSTPKQSLSLKNKGLLNDHLGSRILSRSTNCYKAINDYFRQPMNELKTLIKNPFTEVSSNQCEDSDSEGEVLTPTTAIRFVKGNKKFTIQNQRKRNYIEHALNQKEVYVQYEEAYKDTELSLNNKMINEQLKYLLSLNNNYMKNSNLNSRNSFLL